MYDSLLSSNISLQENKNEKKLRIMNTSSNKLS